MLVNSHRLIERYEVGCDTEQSKESLVSHLTREGFTVANEWLAPLDGEIGWYVLFERLHEDLLKG